MKKLYYALVALWVSASSGNAGFAAPGDQDYDKALAAYKKGEYKAAAQSFHSAVTGGKDTPGAWLYLGHAYMGCNDRTRAAQVYRSLVGKFPSSPEARLASQSLMKIAPVAKPATPGAPAAVSGKKEGIIDRITLYPPKFGHAAISPATFETVKTVVRGLPPQLTKILDEGGATITIAPNIIDKWPGSGDGMKPGSSTTTMGEEVGRTYGHDVHVYEREQIRGTTELKEVRSQSSIRHTTMHELGHAVDDCSGPLSKDSKFQAMLKLDLNDMPDEVQRKISYYLDPGEACAENIKGMIGGDDDSDTVMVMQYMPRIKRLIKEKFKL